MCWHLRHTRYAQSTGIFAACHYFETYDDPERLVHPLDDPHDSPWDLVGHVLQPDVEPMLRHNRIIKATFEFFRALRLFIRAACFHRQRTGLTEFWVISPRFRPDVYLYLRTMIFDHFMVKVLPWNGTDEQGEPTLTRTWQEDTVVARDLDLNSPRVGFCMNLLDDGINTDDFDNGRQFVEKMWEWVYDVDIPHFEGNDYKQWIRDGELVDPDMVDYGMPLAVNFRPLRWAPSPRVSPSYCNNENIYEALGDLGTSDLQIAWEKWGNEGRVPVSFVAPE